MVSCRHLVEFDPEACAGAGGIAAFPASEHAAQPTRIPAPTTQQVAVSSPTPTERGGAAENELDTAVPTPTERSGGSASIAGLPNSGSNNPFLQPDTGN
ncbi:MAG: hypothetical protein HC876_22005, partial [Chloroflexaceae bacterium]|nr:hypothetical protein [Chloroflexaceae bacterium]